MWSIICWATTPDHETRPGVVDIPRVTLMEKDFSD